MFYQKTISNRQLSFKYVKKGNCHWLIVNPKILPGTPIFTLNLGNVYKSQNMSIPPATTNWYFSEKDSVSLKFPKIKYKYLKKHNNPKPKGFIFASIFLTVTFFCIHQGNSSFVQFQESKRELESFYICLEESNVENIYGEMYKNEEK
ncbi:MAG: hypothetical protein MJ188_02215 [Treponema sp.]|nr:hypothetical protein [Treponema sp.]